MGELLLPSQRWGRCTFPWFFPLRTAQTLTAWGPEEPHGVEDPGFPYASNIKLEAEGAGNPEMPAGTDKNKTQQNLFTQPQNQERAAESDRQ